MNALARGAVAGTVATMAHSVFTFGAQALGFFSESPPEHVTENVLRKTGIDEQPEGPEFATTVLSAHLAYGIASGLLYEAVRPLLPRSTPLAGLLFGGGVWALSYYKLLPSLGLHPSPDEDLPARNAAMVLAHAAFGLTVAEVDERLRSDDRTS